MSERWEHHFTLDTRSGRILPAGVDVPEPLVEEIPDEEWREIGTIDPVTGRARLDWTCASRWQPLAERQRW